jgi:uncharacterized protein (TIGR00159 family)
LNLLFHIGFLEVKLADILDIALVSLLLFSLYRLVRGTVALRILSGFLVLYLVFLVVQATKMELLTLILDKFMGVSVIAAIVLFQQEIRKFLLIIGKSTDLNGFTLLRLFRRSKLVPHSVDVTAVVESLRALSAGNIGALIVLSRDTGLENYAETGDVLDARVSKRLLLSIFFKNSPLHDGAVLISKGRIKAARCILPVSDSRSLPANMGLRHRAALGMTEVTDTLVLVVSEETGQLSVARSGRLHPNLSPVEVRHYLERYLSGTEEDKNTEALATSPQLQAAG